MQSIVLKFFSISSLIIVVAGACIIYTNTVCFYSVCFGKHKLTLLWVIRWGRWKLEYESARNSLTVPQDSAPQMYWLGQAWGGDGSVLVACMGVNTHNSYLCKWRAHTPLMQMELQVQAPAGHTNGAAHVHTHLPVPNEPQPSSGLRLRDPCPRIHFSWFIFFLHNSQSDLPIFEFDLCFDGFFPTLLQLPNLGLF